VDHNRTRLALSIESQAQTQYEETSHCTQRGGFERHLASNPRDCRYALDPGEVKDLMAHARCLSGVSDLELLKPAESDNEDESSDEHADCYEYMEEGAKYDEDGEDDED
jgi:hypothetical protein